MERPLRDAIQWTSSTGRYPLPQLDLVSEKKAGETALNHHVAHHSGGEPKHNKLKLVEANKVILALCKEDVGKHLGSPPDWIPSQMKDPPPSLQCASTASNIYRQALKRSHVIAGNDSHSFRNLDQVEVTKWASVMIGAHLAKIVPRSQIRPGDAVIGEIDTSKDPGNHYRHVGFVGELDSKRHSFAAYSNAGGTFRHQNLAERFGKYKHEFFLRLSLPEK